MLASKNLEWIENIYIKSAKNGNAAITIWGIDDAHALFEKAVRNFPKKNTKVYATLKKTFIDKILTCRDLNGEITFSLFFYQNSINSKT